jgi:hypothetical protein
MGLDASLNVRKYLYDEPGLVNLIKEKANSWGFEPSYIEFEVIYWRKAWQVHDFFIDNTTDPTDGTYLDIPRELIVELYDRVCTSINEPSRALDLLPDTCADDWYFSQLKNTKESLENLFNSEFWIDDSYEFYYEASW